jgi:hypothetical protein
MLIWLNFINTYKESECLSGFLKNLNYYDHENYSCRSRECRINLC